MNQISYISVGEAGRAHVEVLERLIRASVEASVSQMSPGEMREAFYPEFVFSAEAAASERIAA